MRLLIAIILAALASIATIFVVSLFSVSWLETTPAPTALPTILPTSVPTPTEASKTPISPVPTTLTEPLATTVNMPTPPAPPTVKELLEGHWKGTLIINKTTIPFMIHFEVDNEDLFGTTSIPNLGAQELELNNISYEHPHIMFDIPELEALFFGKLKKSGILGEFGQRGLFGTFSLKR